jgi:protein TonB
MKNKNSKSQGQLFVVALALALFSMACNNKTESTSSANDSAAVNNAQVTDTGTVKKQATTKKGRASVGVMTASKTTGMKPDNSGVYEMTEVRPSYPGGQTALEDYITNHIEYPQTAVDDNKEGTVNVQFIVDENGNVSNAKVIGNQVGDGLDEEAVRVISKMPKWEPGKVKGKTVKTRLTLPVTYKLEE